MRFSCLALGRLAPPVCVPGRFSAFDVLFCLFSSLAEVFSSKQDILELGNKIPPSVKSYEAS